MHKAGVELSGSFRERMAGLLAGSVDFYNNSTVEGNVHSEPDVWVCREVVDKGRELLRG